MVDKYEVGDTVLLSNRHTIYGDNGIAYWGELAVIDRLDHTWSDGGRSKCAYYVMVRGRKHHVTHEMLSPGRGPW